jgi:hypothetical protein
LLIQRLRLKVREMVVFKNENGEEIAGDNVVFPLFTQGTKKCYQLVGTGFLILKQGIFITAKHCTVGSEDKKLPWLTGLMAHGHMRRVHQVIPHDDLDVAIGIFEPNEYTCDQCLNHPVLSLNKSTPEKGEKLVHFGCEKSRFEEIQDDEGKFLKGILSLRGYSGKYESYSSGDPFAPWPHHFTSSYFPPGSSGGPTVDSSGMVCGVNSSSSDGENPYGRLTRISDLLQARYSDEVVVNNVTMMKPTFEEIILQVSK